MYFNNSIQPKFVMLCMVYNTTFTCLVVNTSHKTIYQYGRPIHSKFQFQRQDGRKSKTAPNSLVILLMERNGTRKKDGTERNEKSGTATQLEGWNGTDGTQYKLNTTDWNCNGAEDMK